MISLAITEHDDAGFVQIVNQLLNDAVQSHDPGEVRVVHIHLAGLGHRVREGRRRTGSTSDGEISQASSFCIWARSAGPCCGYLPSIQIEC